MAIIYTTKSFVTILNIGFLFARLGIIWYNIKVNYTWYSQKVNEYSPESVHQILAYGTLSDIRELKKALGKTYLQKVFLGHPKKLYTSSSLNFIKNFVLNITIKLDEQKYLKNTRRSIGQ